MDTIEPGILTINTYSGFAPVCSRGEDGKATGKDIWFLEEFAKSRGLKTCFRVLDTFEGIWKSAGDGGNCDIAAAGITPTDERKKNSPGTVWSNYYFSVKRSFLIRETDKDIFHTICDFKGKTIMVTKESTADINIRQRNPCNAKVVYSTTQAEAIDDLLEGRTDAFGEGDVSNDYLASLRPGKLLVIDRHDLMAGSKEPFSFPVRAGTGIVEELNEWLKDKTDDYYRNIRPGH